MSSSQVAQRILEDSTSRGVNNDMFSGCIILGTSEPNSFPIIVLFSLCTYIMCRVGVNSHYRLEWIFLAFDRKICRLMWWLTVLLLHPQRWQSSPIFLIPVRAIPKNILLFFLVTHSHILQINLKQWVYISKPKCSTESMQFWLYDVGRI